MRWVRSNIRAGSWCAMLALAIQFALSFGHVHRAEIPWASESSHPTAFDNGAPSATGSDASATAAIPIGVASDYCAICAVMVLANSARPAAAPASPTPEGSIAVRFSAEAAVLAATSPHRHFQARAPPLV